MNINEAKIILGIPQLSLSLEELKKIFKKQILQWHPDIAINRGISHQEATYRSQKIILAYEILSGNLESLEDNSFKHSYETYYSYKTSKPKSYKQYYDYSIDNIDASFINRITLKSSNVKWVDYIKDLEILVVRFKDSSVYYLYYDVPENVFSKFQRVDSPGRFVHQYLRGYKYESHIEYAEWLNIYKSLNEITEYRKNDT
jgi:hypothetical protein